MQNSGGQCPNISHFEILIRPTGTSRFWRRLRPHRTWCAGRFPRDSQGHSEKLQTPWPRRALTKRALVDGDSESFPLKRRRRAGLGKSAGDVAKYESGLPPGDMAHFAR